MAIFDASGTLRGLVPGAQGNVLAWVPEGILVRGGQSAADNALEFKLINESDGSSRLVYRTSAQNVSLAAILSP